MNFLALLAACTGIFNKMTDPAATIKVDIHNPTNVADFFINNVNKFHQMDIALPLSMLSDDDRKNVTTQFADEYSKRLLAGKSFAEIAPIVRKEIRSHSMSNATQWAAYRADRLRTSDVKDRELVDVTLTIAEKALIQARARDAEAKTMANEEYNRRYTAKGSTPNERARANQNPDNPRASRSQQTKDRLEYNARNTILEGEIGALIQQFIDKTTAAVNQLRASFLVRLYDAFGVSYTQAPTPAPAPEKNAPAASADATQNQTTQQNQLQVVNPPASAQTAPAAPQTVAEAFAAKAAQFRNFNY
ncbi:MAG TPA: hypothetical protein VLG38_03210 [Gammaproteobacteria bacterium]|nr:hypothetical protein [Gammaproteobacteria bacterium]